jgi:GAF domain-containing protein
MRHSSASSVAIFRPARGAFVAVCASGSLPAPVDENDAVLVAMRAAKAPVDLHAHASALAGEYAFPMVARGALIGVLVCGPKHGADPYAPDETETLGAVAQAVGVALDALQRGQPEPSETLLSLQLEVAALREDVRELLAAMRLPERS